MSGLLHRLASQALGRTTRVRSASRLPYSEPAPFAEAAAEFDALPANTVGQRGGVADHATTPLETASPLQTSGPELRAEHASGTRLSTSHGNIPARPIAASSRRSSPAPLLEPNANSELASEKTAAWQQALQSEPRVDDTEDLLAEPRNEESATQATAQQRQDLSRTRPPAHPDPLLQPVTPNGPRQRRLTPSLAGKAEQSPEVHVSIGRIEVTAVQEAAPQRRPAPRTAKPMSLQDYLARRGGAR